MKLFKIEIMMLISIVMQSCGSNTTVYKIKDKPTDYSPVEIVNDFYDEDAKLGYTILKDNNTLYVNISTTEISSQAKILQNGVKVFLNKNRSENEAFFIHYPITSETRNNVQRLKQDKAGFLEQKIASLKNDILIVNGDEREIINRDLNNKIITANIKSIEGELFYQMRFPLIYLKTDTDKLPDLGIEVKGLKNVRSSQPAKINLGNRGGTRRGSGGGRSRGKGGMRRSSSSATPKSSTTPQMQGLSTDIEIWLKVDLSN